MNKLKKKIVNKILQKRKNSTKSLSKERLIINKLTEMQGYDKK